MARKANKRAQKKHTHEEKHAILKEAFEKLGFRIFEDWHGGAGGERVFMGWIIYKHHAGRFSFIKNLFELEPTALINDDNLEIMTITDSYRMNFANAKKITATVKKKFDVTMHVYSGTDRII